MAGSPIATLVDAVRRTIPVLETRAAAPSSDALEVVLSRADLDRCIALLSATLGQPAKPFGRAVTLAPPASHVMTKIGGIRVEQCLFVKPLSSREIAYAALWPWESDAGRITLKVGILAL